MVLKYIYHTADLHIRSDNFRHDKEYDEYIDVFNQMVHHVDTPYDESLFVICGDIFHTRVKYSTSAISLFLFLVRELSKKTTVMIMAGNHDIDTKSSATDFDILETLCTVDNVIYSKMSNVYTFDNISITVNDLRDSFISADLSDTFISIIPSLRICMYHGMVGDFFGSNDRSRKVSDFDGYDIVLLGDIHEPQFITDNMAYSGSPIQQTRGEPNIKRHILRWCTEDNSVIQLPIINNYSIHTIEISSETSAISLINPSQYIALHLLCDSVSRIKLDELLNEFKLTQTVVREKIIMTRVSNTMHQKVTYPTISISDYITEYIKDMDNESINWILNKHHNMNICDKTRHKHTYKFISLSFKNIYIYGNDIQHIIKFPDGISGIMGSNNSGKTSIARILLLSLFGDPSSYCGGNTDTCINHAASAGETSISIEIENDIYIITRKYRKASSKTDKVNVVVSVTKNDIPQINYKDILDNILGDSSIFYNLNTYLLLAGTREFKDCTPTDRYKLLQSFMNMDIYDDYRKKIKSDLRDLENKMKEYKSKKEIYSKSVWVTDCTLSSLQHEIHTLEQLIQSDMDEYTMIQRNIGNKTHCCNYYLETHTDIEYDDNTYKNYIKAATITEDIFHTADTNKSLDDLITEHNTLIKILPKLIDTAVSEISDETIDIDTYIEYVKEYNNIQDELKVLTYEKNKYISQYTKIKNITTSSASKILTHLGDTYADNINFKNIHASYELIKKYDNDIKNLHIPETNNIDKIGTIVGKIKQRYRKTDVVQLLNLLENTDDIQLYLNNKIKNNNDTKINELEQCISRENNNISNSIQHLQNDIDLEYSNILARYTNDIQNKQTILTSKSYAINAYNNSVRNGLLTTKANIAWLRDHYHAAIHNHINSKTSLIMTAETLTNNINNNKLQLLEAHKKLDKLKNSIQVSEEINGINVSIDECSISFERLQKYYEIFECDNLPKYHMDTILSNINTFINNFISKLTNLSVHLYLESRGKVLTMNQLRLVIYCNDKAVSTLGKFESLVLDIAFKSAILQYTTSPISRFLILDESIDSIDEMNLQNAGIFMDMIKEHYTTVIIISHRNIEHIIDYQILHKSKPILIIEK